MVLADGLEHDIMRHLCSLLFLVLCHTTPIVIFSGSTRMDSNLYSIALLRRLNPSDDLHSVEEVFARHSRHLSSSLVAVKVAAMVVYGARQN